MAPIGGLAVDYLWLGIVCRLVVDLTASGGLVTCGFGCGLFSDWLASAAGLKEDDWAQQAKQRDLVRKWDCGLEYVCAIFDVYRSLLGGPACLRRARRFVLF
jgi:hypothetical protein